MKNWIEFSYGSWQRSPPELVRAGTVWIDPGAITAVSVDREQSDCCMIYIPNQVIIVLGTPAEVIDRIQKAL